MEFNQPLDAHLAFFGYEEELKKELLHRGIPIHFEDGRFFISTHQGHALIWSQTTWINIQTEVISSINQAATFLKSLNRNWGLWSLKEHRRCELIQKELPHYSSKPIQFLGSLPPQNMGGWTLWDKNTLLYSAKTTSPFARGEFTFQEDKINPPSRAYLKLWEFFTVTGKFPAPHSPVIDMGSCPGGWTWVLSELQCETFSVDKAPLDARLSNRSNIKLIQESAFGLDPNRVGKVEWFFSDIICYPEKLLGLIERWRQDGYAKNFVCTIKYQSETDWKITDEFLKIPGSQIHHLYHNKHEVTWSLVQP